LASTLAVGGVFAVMAMLTPPSVMAWRIAVTTHGGRTMRFTVVGIDCVPLWC